MKDTYLHKGLRKKLVTLLRKKGIREEKILEVIEMIPRHFFFEKAFEEWAYQDKAFPIGHDQTISQPYTVAYQTSLLTVKKRDKILEVGTGSGYQSAILAAMGGRVFTVERQEALYRSAKKLLTSMGFARIRFYFRDGYKGLPEFAPFDKILVTAGATSIPEALKMQLKIGGILVIPVGDTNVQQMIRLQRISENEFLEERFDNFRFVPLLKGLKKG